MPIMTPNMQLPLLSPEDVDQFFDEQKAAWAKTRDRQALSRAANALRTMAALVVIPAKEG